MDFKARWSDAKSAELKRRHGVDFEDVISAVENGGLLGFRDHPNQADYAHQTQMIVQIDDYAYVVAMVVEDDGMFLKTLYPSRRATALFLKKGDN